MCSVRTSVGCRMLSAHSKENDMAYEEETAKSSTEPSNTITLLNKLENRISRTHETIAELEKRLGPILRPEQDSEAPEQMLREAGPHSSMYDQLESLVGRASSLERRLGELIGRMEV